MSATSSSALEAFREYDEMIQNTIEATERANELHDSLVAARTFSPPPEPDEVILPPYNLNYISPLSRRTLATPPVWKIQTGLPLPERERDPCHSVSPTHGTLASPIHASSLVHSLTRSPAASPVTSPTRSPTRLKKIPRHSLSPSKLSPSRRSQKLTTDRLSNPNRTQAGSSPPLDRALLRYHPLVQGDSVCGELLVYGLAGSKSIDHGLQKRLPRNVGLNSRLSQTLSGKLSWGRAYTVLDPRSELLACYTDRMSSKAIKIIRLHGSQLISIGKKKNTGNDASLSMFCWVIQEKRGTSTTKTYTFGVPSINVARLWTHSLRFTITQQNERDILLEERQRKRNRLAQVLTASKNTTIRCKTSSLPNTWEVLLHDVEQCTPIPLNMQEPGQDEAYIDNETMTTKALLKEMGFAVVQDVYKGRIIGNALGTVAGQASIRIQSFLRGSMLRSRFGLRRGRKGLFVRKRSSYHHALLHKSTVTAEVRKLRPTEPYVLSEHMERLLAFAPRTARNAARKIQSMVRGVVVRVSFLLVFTLQRNVCCSIQGWFRMMTKRWIRKQRKAATHIQQDVRRWLAKCRLKELQIETWDFVKDTIVCLHLTIVLDTTLSQRLACNWLRTQICLLRMRRARRSARIISRFCRFIAGGKVARMFQAAVRAVVRVQARLRAKREVMAYRKRIGVALWALRVIVKWWRSHTPRISARTIQSVWRMYKDGRPFHAAKKAALILITRVRGWSCMRSYKRQLSAAVVIESCVRQMVAKRQAKLAIWQIVKIQSLFRIRKSRRVLKSLLDNVEIRRIQTWFRCVVAKYKFKAKKKHQVLISKWWTGLCFLFKLQSAIVIARNAATLIQTHVRGLVARGHFTQDELRGLQEFVDLGEQHFLKVFRTTGHCVRNQPTSMPPTRIKKQKKLKKFDYEEFKKDMAKRKYERMTKHRRLSYVAVIRLNGKALRLDRMQTTCQNYNSVNNPGIQNKKDPPSSRTTSSTTTTISSSHERVQYTLTRIPNVQSLNVTLRELSLAVLVHPWLRRHRLGVQQLIKALAQCPQLFNTCIVVPEYRNNDMHILNDNTTFPSPKNVVLLSALEEYPVRLPRSTAQLILNLGLSQASQMTVRDFVKYAGVHGKCEKTLRNASRHFLNNLFTTDIRDMQADQRHRMIEMLVHPPQRDLFNRFLERIRARFAERYQRFTKLDKIGTSLLNEFTNTKDGLQSLQLLTQPPHLLYSITKQLSKIRPAILTASESYAIHNDAGAYFLAKQIIEFIDTFIAVGSDWDVDTPDKCRQLELRVQALTQCIPGRYRWSYNFAVSSEVVALDGVLGSVYFGRETFVPVFLECLDMLNTLGAVQSCTQDTLQNEQAQTNRVKRELQLKRLIAQRRGDGVSVKSSSIDEEGNNLTWNEGKSNGSEHEENSEDNRDLDRNYTEDNQYDEDNEDNEDDENGTDDIFTLLEHDNSRMTSHLSNIQQYVSSNDLSKLTEKLVQAMPVNYHSASASFDFSMQMQSILTNWVLESAAKNDPDEYPKLEFLQRVPFHMASLHAVMELWESTVENKPTEQLPPLERSHLDVQFISTICDQLHHLGENLQSIDTHKTRCEVQRKRCTNYIKWVHDERKRCLKHCQTSREYLKRCATKQKQAERVVTVAASLSIAPLERPDGVDKSRVEYFESAVVMNSAAFEAATIELKALEDTLDGIRNSNDDCNTTLDRIDVIGKQHISWVKHSNRLHNTTMSRLERVVPKIQAALQDIVWYEESVESMDQVQLVRAATRALDDFELGEQQRNELLASREVSIHEMRSQARIFRKQCREYLLHLWFALDKNVSWYFAWENEFLLHLERPCTIVEEKINVLYDQVKLAQELNKEKVEALKNTADRNRTKWHQTEKIISNFWWFKFTKEQCVWYSKWQQWHETIRHEKKVYENQRKMEAQLAQVKEAIKEAKQIAIAKFKKGDIVEAKCNGWHQWWVGEIRRVEDLIPGSGKFTYFLKFQDGERIRGVEERRLRPPTNKTPDRLFEMQEESLCETSDYTNDSLGNPGSEETDYYFETDSDIPPLDADDMSEEKKQQMKEKAARKKKVLKQRRKNAQKRQEDKKNKAQSKSHSHGANVNGNDQVENDGSEDDNYSSLSSEDEDEKEPDPLQVVLDYAIEFLEIFPNAGRDDVPWEKLFMENGFGDKYSEFEVDRLTSIYDFRKGRYFPVEQVDKIEKGMKEEEETKSVASVPRDVEYPDLIVAALQGDWDRVRIILDSGADVNLMAADEETPLFAAARNGHVEVVRLLVKSGARVNKIKSTTNESAALVARKAKHEDVVELLYELGARHVPRVRPPVSFFGHRKLENLEISETESDRSSDRHSWDLDADHPLNFEDMFKPVSVRRKEKKHTRRLEKIALKMKNEPLTEEEKEEMLFRVSKRTALQQWDTIVKCINEATAAARKLAFSFTPPFKHNVWNADTKVIDQDPIKLMPQEKRAKMLNALSHLHRLRLTIEWRDYPAACKLSKEVTHKFEVAKIRMNEAGGVMHFANGPWNTLAATELSWLGQISSAVPTLNRLLLNLQSRYDLQILEHLPEAKRLVDIGNYADPACLDATNIYRLLQIFHRLSTLPIKKKVKLTTKQRKKAAKQAALEADAYNGETKQSNTTDVAASAPAYERPKERHALKAEAAAKLAAATLEEKVLEPKMIVQAYGEFTKRKVPISAATMKYHVRHRYNSMDGHITWAQFVDCATTPLKSRLHIHRMYHISRGLKAKELLRKKFVQWAISFKNKMYLKYGQDLPGLRWIKEKAAATRIQNWYRCFNKYYAFLKQKYVFDQCKKVQEAGLVLQNFFWRHWGRVALRERVTRDFIMVWDEESQSSFYVDTTCMRGRLNIPHKGWLREYATGARYTNLIILRAIRPQELSEKAKILNKEKLIKGFAGRMQKALAKSRGKMFSREALLAVICEEMEKDNTDDGVAHANGILECLVSHGILEYNENSGRFRVTVTYRGDIAAKNYY